MQGNTAGVSLVGLKPGDHSATGGGRGLGTESAWRWEILVGALIALAIFGAEFTPFHGYDWLRMHVFHKEAYREAWSSGEVMAWDARGWRMWRSHFSTH